MNLRRFLTPLLGCVFLTAVVPWGQVHAVTAPDHAFRSPLQVPAPKGAKPISSPLLSVAVAGQRLVAVGQRGDIVYSDDQGRHWSQASVPVSTDLTAVYFPTARQGWAVGQSGVILHSSDGGASWSLQINGFRLGKLLVDFYERMLKSESGGDKKSTIMRELRNAKAMAQDAPALALLDVWFKNAKVGFVVGQFNIILKTVNGGKTWIPLGYQVPTPQSHHLYSIRGSDGSLYITGEQGLVLHRSKGADAFTVIPTPYKGSFFGVAAGDGVVVVFGLQGRAYLSRDGGASWQRLQMATQSAIVGGVVDNGYIVLATLSGKLFASSVRTLQFKRVVANDNQPIYGLTAIGAGVVVTVGPSRPRVIHLENPK